jgi:hypothetical protein
MHGHRRVGDADDREGRIMVGVVALLTDIGPSGDRFGPGAGRAWPQWLAVACGAVVAVAVGRLRLRPR